MERKSKVMTLGKIESSSKEKPLALELRKVGKIFRSDTGANVKALEDVNLRVHQEEFVTLVGATGCGKTTLLNLIAGLDTADEGSLCLGQGLRFGDNIAHVFQHYTLFPWRTVVSNVSFGLQMRGVPRTERHNRAAVLLAKVGLKGFENAYPIYPDSHRAIGTTGLEIALDKRIIQVKGVIKCKYHMKQKSLWNRRRLSRWPPPQKHLFRTLFICCSTGGIGRMSLLSEMFL